MWGWWVVAEDWNWNGGDKGFHAFTLGIFYLRNFRQHCPPGLSRGLALWEDFPAIVVIREGLSFRENLTCEWCQGPATTDQWAPGSAFAGLELSPIKDLKATGSLHAMISKCSLRFPASCAS